MVPTSGDLGVEEEHCALWGNFFKDLGEPYVSHDRRCYAIFVMLMFADTFIFTNAWKLIYRHVY